MKKTLALFVTLIAMSMVFVACETDEPHGGKSYNDYLEFLLGLPTDVSEDGDKIYVKQVEDLEEFELVIVLTFTFEKDICVKAICDYVYPTEEMAKMAYEMMESQWDEMYENVYAEFSYEKRIFTIDFTKTPDLFVGLTRDEIGNVDLDKSGRF